MTSDREQDNAGSLYSRLPVNTHICNKQLREAEIRNQQLEVDLNFSLTEKPKNLIEREEKYEYHKQEFYTN